MSPAEKEGQSSKPKPPACRVEFTIGEQLYQGTATQFNESGIFVLCRQPAPINARISLTLDFPVLGVPFDIEGDVVWTNTYGPNDAISPRGMGVKFINVEAELARTLIELANQYYQAYGNDYLCYYA